jgi:hypothetical protein
MSQIIIECPIWRAILADERLAGARRKLSFHEIRLIIGHALASCDTHAKRGDSTQIEATSLMSGAVPPEEAGDAQPQSRSRRR